MAMARRAASIRPSTAGRSCINSMRIAVASFHDPVRAAARANRSRTGSVEILALCSANKTSSALSKRFSLFS